MDRLWSTCWVDLIHLKEELEDLDLCFPQESPCSTDDNSGIRSIVRENIQKLINAQHPQLKQTFLHCLRKNGLPFRVSGEENNSKIWYASFIKLLFSRPSVPRRNLGQELPQKISVAPSPGPAVISPTPSLAPSPDLSPSPASAISNPQVPESLRPASSPKKAFFPKLDPSAAGDASITPSSDAGTQADKKSNHEKTVVLAVVITALVTFVVAALLFLCCSRFCRNKRVKQNDERPLLRMSLSDFSVGTYHITLLSHLVNLMYNS